MTTGPAEGDGWPVQIVALRSEHLAQVGEVFAGSHADYPPFRHLFPDPAKRAAVLRRFFTATVRDALLVGAVDAALADSRLLGVAVWLGANAERLHPRERHWDLETMGIAPQAQGQGIGTRLIAPGLGQRCEQRAPRTRSAQPPGRRHPLLGVVSVAVSTLLSAAELAALILLVGEARGRLREPGYQPKGGQT